MSDIGRVAIADAFRRILLQPNSVTISADAVDDQLTLIAGNFIEFVVDANTDTLQINASSTISAAFEGGNVPLVTNFTNTQAATNTATGAVRITGGLGVGGAVYASSIQNTPIGSSTRSSGAFTSIGATGTATLEGTVTINGADVSTSIVPTGIGSVTINPATAGTINNMSIGTTTRSSGAFTTLDANNTSTLSGAVTATGSNVNITLSPTGTGVVTIQPAAGLTINPTVTGTINNTSIGASTRSTGAFTTLTADNLTTFTNNTQSTTTSSGAVVVTGGVGIGGNLVVGGTAGLVGDVTLTGNLAVNGGDITTTAATVNLIDATATTINFGRAATAITIGAATGYSDVRNELRITKNTASSSTSTGSVIVSGGMGVNGNVHAGGTGNFVGIVSTGTVTLSPENANVAISPTGTGTVTISPAGALTVNPSTAGTINNMSIGASTRSSGAFTTLGANNTATFTGVISADTGANNQSYTTTGAGVITIASGTTGSINNFSIGSVAAASGAFTSVSGTGNITFNGANAAISLQPSGTGNVTISPAGTLTINPGTSGTINNTSVGSSVRSSGAFTTLAANNSITFNTDTNNQSYTTTGAGTITIESGTLGSLNNIRIGNVTAAAGRFTTVESTVSSGTAPFIVASTTVVSNLQAQTASKLHTARTIALSGVVSGTAEFDGSGNINITTTGGATEVTLGTGTTGQYAASIAISGNGISATTPNIDDGTAYTITSSATSDATGNTIVYRDASGNFSAGTISSAISASTVSASSTVTFNPANANISLSPTGTGTVTLNPATTGTINNMSVGATTRSSGQFTTLESNGQTRFTAGINSTNNSTGTLVVTGGVGVSGTVRSGSLSTSSGTFTSSVNTPQISLGNVTLESYTAVQFNTDTTTDIDLTPYFVKFSNYTQFIKLTVTGLYINDSFAPTVYSRIHKSMISGIWWNGTNFQLDGPVVEHQSYNTDSTNFPAGATPTAGKVQLVIGTEQVLLRLTNRTSPSVNSSTYWNIYQESMSY
jgi:hypothetical protein